MPAYNHGRRVAGVAVVVLTLATMTSATASVPPYRDGDTSITALNILPPGQGQHLNPIDFVNYELTAAQPDHNSDQLTMYEDLIRKAPGLTEADLPSLFKDASFGVAPGDAGRTYSPRPGSTVIRDLSFNVPHVYGQTRGDTMFGSGYVSAEDRLFMMDVLRHLARGRLSEMLGASDANLTADRAQRAVADYTEDELLAMGQRLLTLDDTLGALAFQDIRDFTDGVNAYIGEALVDPTKLPAEYAAIQVVPAPWRVTDSIALSTLIGGQFSVGGGGQLRNARFLDALEADHDPADARAIFDDMKEANDPEAPTSVTEEFPFNTDAQLGPVDPDAVARPDEPAALAAALRRTAMPRAIDGPFGSIRLLAKHGASNALLVAPGLSEDGHPLAVFGPQVGYYAPEILMEIDMHGPGIQARGAAFPGISLYVLLGRGAGYGWSATTAIGDHIDIRAERLCDRAGGAATIESDGYLLDGQCVGLYKRTDQWLAKPTASGVPEEPSPDRILVSMDTERSNHGIVLARGTVGGAPVAFVRERSSYNREVDATLTFVTISDPNRIHSIADLQHAFGDWFSFSFNWHLVDGDHMGWITTGRYPNLAPGVDPELPFWGDRDWDWQGFLPYEAHPQAVDPAAGFITNWNNKQAPGFRASDDWWAYGSVARKELLTDGVLAAMQDDGKVSLTELVQAMGLGATRDLRGAKVLPFILDVIGTPEDEQLADAVATLQLWTDSGANRRDLTGDGIYDDSAAVALMDALWEPVIQAIFEPELGASALTAIPLIHDDAPGAGGSAYFEGFYGQVQKDLRTILGEPVQGAFSRIYCGGGDSDACREVLTGALADAVDAVTAKYASADPTAWKVSARCDAGCDQIVFSAVGAVEERTMEWQNRPTFQQVLVFE